MTREELLEKISRGTAGYGKHQVKHLLGVEFTKGWRRKVLKQYGLPDLRPKKGGNKKTKKLLSGRKQLGEKGFLYRENGSGRQHVIVNGRALCRIKPNWKRYVFSEVQPDIPVCTMCHNATGFDPLNVRETQKTAKSRSKAFYQSWEWKKLRFEVLKYYGAECMCCGSTHHIVVDHIKSIRRHPDLSLDFDNLQVLCNDCNMGKSYDDETDFRPETAEFTELTLVAEAKDKI